VECGARALKQGQCSFAPDNTQPEADTAKLSTDEQYVSAHAGCLFCLPAPIDKFYIAATGTFNCCHHIKSNFIPRNVDF